jgi:hypothetical protein
MIQHIWVRHRSPTTTSALSSPPVRCPTPRRAHPSDEALHHRRDEAIIRLMLETAIPSGSASTSNSTTSTIAERLVTIRCGKEGWGE